MKGKIASAKSLLEEEMAFQLKTTRLDWVREFRWHPERKWRADFAESSTRIIVEVEGGIWIAGRHNRGAGMLEDMVKYAEAACLGWTVLRVAGEHIKSGQALLWVERLVASKTSAAGSGKLAAM